MTESEFLKYKQDFKSIVYLKGQITDKRNYVKTLCAYDKNDSHKQAILLGLSQLEKVKKEFAEKLNGVDYHHMMLSLRKATLFYKHKDKNKLANFNPF